MAYIHRTLEQKVMDISRDYSCLLLIGPRQVGKTTMLEHLMEGSGRQKVTLDDVENRRLAQSDPALFLEMHPAPVLIDEVQYAPQLFSYIKINVDNGAAPGSYWLTGSQAFQLMELAQESLAGRTAIVHMSALSQSELYGDGTTEPLSLKLEHLNRRKEHLSSCNSMEMFERIWNGGMPGHRSGRFTDRDVFYSSYIQTYINRDVSDMIPGVDKLLFADFIRAAACRVGQMLNTHDMAQDVGVSDDTAKRWLQVLEKSEVVFYLRPYSNNLLKRTVKTPKMYFFDTGLACFEVGIRDAETLERSYLKGRFVETFIANEIRKSYMNNGIDQPIYYYRDNQQNEVDLVLIVNGGMSLMEIKTGQEFHVSDVKAFRKLSDTKLLKKSNAIICNAPKISVLSDGTYILPATVI